MGSKLSIPIRAFGLPDSRFSMDTLSSTYSSYSQQGPRPGSAVPSDTNSELVVQTAGEQSDDWLIQATHAGMPTLARPGCRLGYRKSSEAAAALRGWNPPNVITGWRAARYDPAATATYGLIDATVIPSTQHVCLIYSEVSASQVVSFERYDPFTDTWPATNVALPNAATTTANQIQGICCLPGSERLLALVRDDLGATMYYSDDLGATWAIWNRDVLETLPGAVTNGLRGRLLYHPSGELVFVYTLNNGGVVEIHQYASSDLGSTFQGVVAWIDATFTTAPEVVVLPSGRIGCITVTGAGVPQWRSVGSPWVDLSAATPADIDAVQTVAEVTAYVDHDGAIYVLGRNVAAQQWYVWRSDDEGETWIAYDYGLLDSSDASTYPKNAVAVAAAGAGWMGHQWAANPGDEDLSVGLMRLGGWSSLCTDIDSSAVAAGIDGRRIGFGPTSLAARASITWLPLDLPGDCGWTRTQAGGATDTLTAGVVELVTAGAPDVVWYARGGGTYANGSLLVELVVVSGGSVATQAISAESRVRSGANSYTVSIRASTTQFRVYDEDGAATLATITANMTLPIQIWIVQAGSRCEVYYRRPYQTTWTQAYQGTTTAGGGATAYVHFGNIVAGTGTSRWRFVAWLSGHAGNSWQATASGSASHNLPIAKAITAAPYPLGDTATAGATFLRGLDGPARSGEQHTIAAAYDYGIDRIHYAVSPTPQEQWRTAAGVATEQIIAYIPAGGTLDTCLPGTSIALVVCNANFRTAYLEGWDGAAWQTLLTYDAATGFTGLTCAVSGDIITPGATADAGRYLQRGELVGGTIVAGGVYRRIEYQEEGAWTQSTTRVPRIRVDSTGAGAGACTIIHHSGVAVVHDVTTAYDRYRIRIPAQTTVDGEFRAGLITPVGLVFPGLQWAWGATLEHRPITTDTRNRRGTLRRRQEGTPQRILTIPFSDGYPQYRIRSGLNLDYLAPGTTPAGTHRDVPALLAGLLRDSLSGQIPVLVLPSVPAATTITDPTLWLLGHLTSSVQSAHVLGAEGSSEMLRMETLSLEELV